MKQNQSHLSYLRKLESFSWVSISGKIKAGCILHTKWRSLGGGAARDGVPTPTHSAWGRPPQPPGANPAGLEGSKVLSREHIGFRKPEFYLEVCCVHVLHRELTLSRPGPSLQERGRKNATSQILFPLQTLPHAPHLRFLAHDKPLDPELPEQSRPRWEGDTTG